MKNFYSYIRNFKLPNKMDINVAFSSFSKKERRIFALLVIVLLLSTLAILQTINKSFMVNVPLRGGAISEGIMGTPRFINPILATSSADQDLTMLIYSGLMRKNTDGTLSPDLAKSYEMSPNGLNYTFTLKDNLFFQDGKTLTVDDIIFTVNKVKDSIIKSPQKINWDGVDVEKVDEKTILFSLKQPYSSFLNNTTLGIMPMHLWDGTPLELNDVNTNPIGSGPFMIKKVNKQSTGIIDSYQLVPFKKFILGTPYITNLNLYFYQNEEDLVRALENGTVDEISSITPLNAEILKERNFDIESIILPRIFGLFFNQNVNQLFTDKNITNAINQAINKDRIIRDVFFGYGSTIDSPIPSSILKNEQTTLENNSDRDTLIQKIQESLAKGGWKKGDDGFLEKTITENKKKVTKKLSFSISTGNSPEFIKTAEFIKQDLAEIGIEVDVKTFEIGNLNQNIIRPRKYDALLFGEIVNNESDLFAFWHSTQRKDPGLNVAMYTNVKVDKILEEIVRTIDETIRNKKYLEFENEIKKDLPAVFLYSPNFVYVVSKNLNRERIKYITTPSDRYYNVYSWYIQTENVWKIFTK